MNKLNNITNNISIKDLISILKSIENGDAVEIKEILKCKLSPSSARRLLKDLEFIDTISEIDRCFYQQCIPDSDDYFTM